jgi:hypothetical protein
MSGKLRSSTPKPCTPSTTYSIRSLSSRVRFTCSTSLPISPIGSFTPLPDCTQVMPSTRVLGRMAWRMALSTSSAVTLLASSNSLILRTCVPCVFYPEVEGVLGRVMFVFADQDFLVRAYMNAAIDHRGEAFGGAAGQGDLFRLGVADNDRPKPARCARVSRFLADPNPSSDQGCDRCWRGADRSLPALDVGCEVTRKLAKCR